MIGNKLRELRKKHNKNQSDIATLLNISKVTYGHYERGRNEPDISSLVILANYYNITVDELINHNPSKSIRTSFTAEEQEKLLDVINLLANKLK